MIIRLLGWLARRVVSPAVWRSHPVTRPNHHLQIVAARFNCYLLRLWRRDWKRRWVHFGLFWRF